MRKVYLSIILFITVMILFCFIEVKASLGARDNLGRPTTSAIENKENFMSWLTL